MSDRSLSRRLATSIVETLKSQDHILVVKGGSEALVRELDVLMAPQLASIAPLLSPRALLVDEVTSTFGTEAVDETVEDMVGKITGKLMDSDHVEDVFADDSVIRRDVFRVVRDMLLGAGEEDIFEEDEGPGSVTVRLDTLGYVAKAVANRADAETLRDALERAAETAQAELAGYEPDAREATFGLEHGGPDRRLELEEIVADELAELVDAGLVDLPTIEREIPLPREVPPAERTALRSRIDVVAAKTLMRSGCAATWEFVGPSAARVSFTPMSDKDARDVDGYVALFARELTSVLTESWPQAARERPAEERLITMPMPETAEALEPAAEAEEGAPAEVAESPKKAAPTTRPRARAKEPAAPASKRPGAAAKKTAASKRTAKTPARKTAATPAKARKTTAKKTKR